MSAPVALLRPAVMSDGSPFPLLNMWDVETPDGRFLSDITTSQVRELAAREGWQVVAARDAGGT